MHTRIHRLAATLALCAVPTFAAAATLDDFRDASAWKAAASDQVTASLHAAGAKPTVVLYAGDWDPSGLYMSEVDLPTRLERYGGQQEFRRIAIVKSDQADLPHFEADTKAGDARHRWFVERYGHRCWELDAMNPSDLRDRVRSEIVSYIDEDLWQRATEIEAAEVGSMTDFRRAWQERLAGGGQ